MNERVCRGCGQKICENRHHCVALLAYQELPDAVVERALAEVLAEDLGLGLTADQIVGVALADEACHLQVQLAKPLKVIRLKLKLDSDL